MFYVVRPTDKQSVSQPVKIRLRVHETACVWIGDAPDHLFKINLIKLDTPSAYTIA